jgi:hypothetical protein
MELLIQNRLVKPKDMNTQNINALESADNFISKHNQEILILFKNIRRGKLQDRLRLREICGLYRQTKLGTFFLILALIFKLA